MKQFLISMYQPDGGAPSAEFLQTVMTEIAAIREELQSTGSWVFGNGLADPSTATVLRARHGEVITTDGPFVEGKEHLGGVTIIKASNVDTAIEWGARYARATTLPIEVRPFLGDVGD